MAEEIVTRFTADLSDLERGVNDYAKALGKAENADESLSKSQKDLAASTGSAAAKFDAMAKSGAATSKAIRDQALSINQLKDKIAALQKLKGTLIDPKAIAAANKEIANLQARLTALDNTGKAVGKTQESLGRSIVNNIAGYLGLTAILVKVGAEFRKLIDLAGTIEKTDARARAIAGETLPLITKAAEDNANAIGLTRREYIALAVDQQLRLKNLGLEGEFTAELATKTVDLSEKLSDFSGGQISAQDASQLLNDALTGQTKGLKALGINIKSSKDDLNALSTEFQTTRGVTKEQGDALANLELVFRATQSSLDEFAKSELSIDAATDLSNARLKEQEEALAERLAPAINTVRNAFASFLGLLAGTPDSKKLDDIEARIFELLPAFDKLDTRIEQALTLDTGASKDEAQKALDQISLAVSHAAGDLGRLELIRQSLVKSRQEAENGGDGRKVAVITAQLELLAKAQSKAADAELNRNAAARKANEEDQKTATTLGQKRAALLASLQQEKDAKELLAADDSIGRDAANASIASIEEQIKALDGLTEAQKKASEEAKKNAAIVIEGNKQIDEILQGVARQREDATLTESQKEIEAVKRKYKDIAAKTKEGFEKIAAATPASGQAEVKTRASDAQAKIDDAQAAELLAIGQRTLEKLQNERDAAEAVLLARKKESADQQLAILLEEQAREQAAVEAHGGDLAALFAKQARDREALMQAGEEAALQSLLQEFDKEVAALGTNDEAILALTAQFETELEALKDGFRRKNLTKEQENAQKILEQKRAAKNAELQIAAEGFQALQEFSDLSFDKRIARVEEQEAILQDKLTQATDEAQKARIQKDIDNAERQKAALERQKKEQQKFAIAAALISTYLSAQLAYQSTVAIAGPIAAAVAAAVAVAEGLLNVAKIKGFDEGGHTGKRTSNKEAVGVVHANEWVAPAWQVKDPRYADTIKWLEEARKRKGAGPQGPGFIGGGSVTSRSACEAAGGQWINGACVMGQLGTSRPTRGTALVNFRGPSAEQQCSLSGGVWINGACVRPEDAPRAFIGEERVGKHESPIWSGPDGYLRRVHKDEGIVDARTNMEHLPAINAMRSGTFDDFIGANYLMPLIDALNHRDDAKAADFVQTDMGQRMANSVMLAKFYDKNIVEGTERTNKALREQTKLLEALVNNSKPQSKRYH